MGNNEQQVFGAVKLIFVIALLLIFNVVGYILIESTAWKTAYVMPLITLIGLIILVVFAIGWKGILWLEDYVAGREKTTKADRDSVETTNVSTEPKKKSKVQKLRDKLTIKKVGETIPEDAERIIGKNASSGGTLPIEKSTETKLPIEQ